MKTYNIFQVIFLIFITVFPCTGKEEDFSEKILKQNMSMKEFRTHTQAIRNGVRYKQEVEDLKAKLVNLEEKFQVMKHCYETLVMHVPPEILQKVAINIVPKKLSITVSAQTFEDDRFLSPDIKTYCVVSPEEGKSDDGGNHSDFEEVSMDEMKLFAVEKKN